MEDKSILRPTICRLCLTLILLILACTLATAQESTTLLESGNVPGFYLNRVYTKYSTASGMQEYPGFVMDPSTTGFATTVEVWTTVERRLFNKMVYSGEVNGSDALLIRVTRIEGLSSAAEAQRYVNFFATGLGHWQPNSPSGAPIGDHSWYQRLTPSFRPDSRSSAVPDQTVVGQDGLSVISITGTTIVTIKAHGYGGRLMDQREAERIARVAVSRADARAFSFSADVISKHVKPKKSERVEVLVTSNRYPASYRFELKRKSAVVYSAATGPQTAAYRFIWNGYTNAGQPAGNGEHDLIITATDSLGRTATQTAKVVVNF